MTTKGTQVAKRYAKALFGMCEQQAFESVEAQLKFIAACLEVSSDFQRVVSSPTVTMEQQESVVEGLLASSHLEYSDLVRRFVKVLFEARRFSAVAEISHLFGELVANYRKNLSVEVVTAAPVPENERGAFVDRLKETLGSGVTVAWEEDKAIGGGAILRSGDRLIDRSVVGVLEQMRSELLA